MKIGLIGSLNDALRVIKSMSTKEINFLVYDLEVEGWYRENRRRTRSWCEEVAISNWHDLKNKSAIIRCIYNNVEA